MLAGKLTDIFLNSQRCCFIFLTLLVFHNLSYADINKTSSLAIPVEVTLTTAEKNWIKNHPLVAVGGGPDWAPFDFVDKHGQYSGIASDYLKLIATKTGLSFKVSIDQWSNQLQKIREKQIDLLGAAYYTEARSQYVNYSTPYFEVLDYFFVRHDLPVKSLKDLNGKRVAIPKDYAHGDFIKKHFPNIKIVTVNTFSEAIDAVLENRADLLYDAYAAIIYALKKEGISTIIPFKSTRAYKNNPIHIISRKDAPELASIIQKGLDAISLHEREAIYKKWLGNSSAKKTQWLKLTAEQRRWLDKHKTIRFTGDPNWLPYEAFDKQGNYIGIVADYLQKIEQRLGIKFTIVPTQSWSVSIAKVKQGEIDVLSETTDSELGSHLQFTKAYLSSPIVIVMRDSEDYVESIDQISHKKIAFIKDYGYTPTIKKKYKEIDFKTVNTVQEGLTGVSTGKIDALLVTLAQSSYQISNLGISNIRIVGKTEFATKLAFGIRKDYLPLVALFNRALEDISANEEKHILEAWGKHKFATKTDYQLIAKVAAGLLLIIAAFIYWNRKMAVEIARRKQAENQTQTLIDTIPLQIVVTSMDGQVLTANPKALKDNKIHKDEIELYNIADFYKHPGDREMIIKELSENGKVIQKIVPFKQLDGTIRSMMISIMPISYHNRNAFVTISVDMTERLEIEAALQKAKEDAEAANHAKSEFLSNMSHEIRTPMNAIIGFTELLNDQIQEPKHQSFVKTIQSAGNNLLTLINDILDLSKIEAGKMDIEKTSVNPHELFTELANIFMMNIRKKNLELILEVDPEIPESLMLDATRLRQVLFNLIGNAIKFTEQGYIKIIATASNENEIRSKLDLLIDIQDTGIGIPEQQLHKIFNEFEQTDGQDQSKFGGTGLGLAISRRLTNLMGGMISVTSEPGIGSTFTVSLNNVDVASVKSEAPKSESFVANTVKFAPAVILVVDDIDSNRQLICENFAGTELTVLQAENGQEAVIIAQQQDIDLILMDIRMPVMDGYQAAEQIKAFKQVPIIALTASVMKSQFDLARHENFDDYLRKPVLRSDLLTTLNCFLEHQIIKLDEQQSTKIELSAAEQKVLPDVLIKLDQQMEQWRAIRKSNNISEIKQFVDALLAIAEQYDFEPVLTYANRLTESINAFDIDGITRLLNEFSDFQNWLLDAETV